MLEEYSLVISYFLIIRKNYFLLWAVRTSVTLHYVILEETKQKRQQCQNIYEYEMRFKRHWFEAILTSFDTYDFIDSNARLILNEK